VRYFLELCLKSVEAAVSSIEAEVIVVDNNSSDDSCKMFKELFPEVVIIENKENFGFSKANNQGISIAKGEYICIINPDTVVAEDTFISLLNFAEEQKNLGIVGCKLIDGTGQFLPESKRNIPVVKVAVQKVFGNSKKYYANHLNENEIGKVDVLVGAFMLMKQETYNKVNGFDEDYFMYGEDIDLSYRILSAGYNNYYFGSTTIIHYKGESTLKNKDYAKRFYKAMQIFYKKHFRRNVIFDTLVWLGIKLAYFVRNQSNFKEIKSKKFILISDTINDKLQQTLAREIIRESQLFTVEKGTEIILDANFLSYKSIIEYISNDDLNEKASFKILPKNSSFIIGSNSSKSKGEVISFE
jgi:GT2 family glycosyltransferase